MMTRKEIEASGEHSKEEVASPKTPDQADDDQVWKRMGLNKPPEPPRRRTGLGATKRRNSNQRQNERNLAKKLMIRGMDLHGGMHPGLHPRVHGVAGPRLHGATTTG